MAHCYAEACGVMAACEMVRRSDGHLLLRLTNVPTEQFDAALADFKATVPAAARRYDAEVKCWVVDGGYEERLRRWIDQLSATTSHVLSQDEAYAVLWLRPGAPSELVAAAYRTLAKLRHPDAGGSDEAMRDLNAAHARIARSRQ